MTSKIRIKLGPVEVEYEGNEAFLKDELPDLLSAVARLHKESGQADGAEPPVLLTNLRHQRPHSG